MTTMTIDNKAFIKPAYEYFKIDRTEYKTIDDLLALACECMNEDVYLIRVYENDEEVFTVRNNK